MFRNSGFDDEPFFPRERRLPQRRREEPQSESPDCAGGGSPPS